MGVRNVTKLDKERPEWDLLNFFHAANSLHVNFYENWLTPEAVARGVSAIKDFYREAERADLKP